MDIKNIPLQMFHVTSTTGEIRPIQFRRETENHTVQTVKVDEILSIKENNYAGINDFVFTCKSMSEDNIEELYELRYIVKTHKWLLYRM